MTLDEAVQHLARYVAENDSLSMRDLYSFTQRNTELDEEDVAELIERLAQIGIEVYDSESVEEEAALEGIEERERGLIRDNPQIYMRELANHDVLTRNEELECARTMHSGMSKALEGLAAYRPVADRVVEIFEKNQSRERLYLALNGFLDPVYELPNRLQDAESSENDDSDELFFEEAQRRIERYRIAYASYFNRPTDQRNATLASELEESLHFFKFTTNHYNALLDIHKSIADKLDEQLQSVQEICEDAGVSIQSIEDQVLPNLTSRPVSDTIRLLPGETHEALRFKTRFLERARIEIRELENETQLDLLDLRERSERVKRGVHTYKTALNRLVSGNLRLVMKLVQSYTNFDPNMLDLVQEGNLGLIRAAEKFDYTRGFRFSTYASRWISQYINLAVQDASRSVRLPAKLLGAIQKINRSRTLLTQSLAREPTMGEIAEHANIDLQLVRDATMYEAGSVSMDEPVNEDENTTLVDTLVGDNVPSPEDLAMAEGLREAVEMVLSDLTTREAQMLSLRFGIGRTSELSNNEVAEEFSIAPNRVRQVTTKALRRLRFPKYRDLLEPYLQ